MMERDFNFAAFGCVAHGVAHDVLDGAPEQSGHAVCHRRFACLGAHRTLTAVGFKVCIVGHVAHELAEVYARVPVTVRAAFEARQREQLSNHLVDAFGLAPDAVQVRARLRVATTASQFEGDAEARERRAQLVRDVAEQSSLRRHERFDARRHRVKVAPHVCQLVAPPAKERPDARREVAA
jgi:hypothetical protein